MMELHKIFLSYKKALSFERAFTKTNFSSFLISAAKISVFFLGQIIGGNIDGDFLAGFQLPCARIIVPVEKYGLTVAELNCPAPCKIAAGNVGNG